MKTAVQLYTLRGEIKNGESLLRILAEVRRLGFEGVEFAGYHGLSAEAIRARLDELGLKAVGTHLPLSALEGEALGESLAFVKAIGSEYIGTGGAPFMGKKGLKRVLEIMANADKRASEQGLCAYYHNHWREFKQRGGESQLDAVKRVCSLELDTYWSFFAGVESAEYIRKNAEKISLIHIKDGSRRFPKPCALGEGENRLEEIIEAGREIGCEWLILENDMPKPDGLSDIARSMEYLKSHGF